MVAGAKAPADGIRETSDRRRVSRRTFDQPIQIVGREREPQRTRFIAQRNDCRENDADNTAALDRTASRTFGMVLVVAAWTAHIRVICRHRHLDRLY